MVEGLCGLVREAIKKNLFEGVMVGGGEVTISILQFEDDTLFFVNDGNISPFFLFTGVGDIILLRKIITPMQKKKSKNSLF